MRRRAVGHVRVERRRVRRATESPKGPTTEISVSLDTTATLWAIDKPGSCISHSKVRLDLTCLLKSLEGGLTGCASGAKARCRKSAQRNDPTSSKRGYVGLHSEAPNEKRRSREGHEEDEEAFVAGGDGDWTILTSIRQRRAAVPTG
jgi:hypothetical protein